MLEQLTKTGKQLIYVNLSGSAIALNWVEKNASTIVQGFYPGETTGTALARLIFGDFGPSGKLLVTFYRSVDDLPDFKDYAMANRAYKYNRGEVLYPFGFGLSYADINYEQLSLS
ncbi:MAG: glycoside hydrolase family 3 C-terminal domain-containing protein [Kangiellaceae bacterium]|nr:glycoside hydrolase family 3 C-terminal domain-containing protein [Kangiellaceae bacterium]